MAGPSNELILRVMRDFKYHPPTPEKAGLHAEVNDLFARCAERVLEVVPEGRELALVLTKLQEARMWANAGIALSGPEADG